MAFNCRRCGKCCEEIVITVSYSDIKRWLNKGRKDILYHISWINNYPKKDTGGFYIRETVQAPKRPCPFLQKDKDGLTTCTIQNTKPKACRDAPLSLESFPICPEYENEGLTEIKKKLKEEQYTDYKKAFDQREYLLQILFSARGG